MTIYCCVYAHLLRVAVVISVHTELILNDGYICALPLSLL